MIAFTSGSHPTGGFSIKIDQIEKLVTRQGEEWMVHYTEKGPGSDWFVTQQTTTPTIFVLTEPTNAKSKMQGKTITAPCNN